MKLEKVFHWLSNKVQNYNLFMIEENDYDDDNEGSDSAIILQRQKYTTRLYIFILILFLYILFYTTLIESKRQTIIVENINPDLFNELYNEHAESLLCSCSTASIPYETFISIHVTFHDVCSSYFIDPKWIETLYAPIASRYGVGSFRTTASFQFELLKRLCLFSQHAIDDNLIKINQTELISIYIQPEFQLEIQVKETIESMKNILLTQMNSFINYIRIMHKENYVISAVNTNVVFVVFNYDDLSESYSIVGLETKTEESLSMFKYEQNLIGCSRNSIVTTAYLVSADISSDFILHQYWNEYQSDFPTLSGFFVGCTASDALLQSTLECLYDTNCLQLLTQHFPNLNQTNINEIDNIVLTKEFKNSSINNLLTNLLIDQWSIEVNYSNYFSKCNPSFCTYMKTNQIHLSDSFTLFVSLYGGLVITLRLITPFLMKIILKMKRKLRNPNDNPVFHNRNLQTFVQFMKRLNLFKMANQRTETDIQQQRLITRLYLTLLISSIIILLLFNALKSETVIQTVPYPSFMTYKQLQIIYSNTLKCTCSRIAIAYEIFTSLSIRLHEVCSSDFVSDKWILILQSSVTIDNAADWRQKAYSEFHLLSTLCQLAKKTIDASIDQFLSKSFIVSNMISEIDFNEQLNKIFSQFTNSIRIHFNTLIDTVELTTEVDQPLMGIVTSSVGSFKPQLTLKQSFNQTSYQIDFSLRTISNLHSNESICICAANSNCISPVGFYNSNLLFLTDRSSETLEYEIPGLVTACSTMKSLLLSTLQCFYSNAECFSIVMNYIKKTHEFQVEDSKWFDVRPLIYNSELSRFPPNTTIIDIIQDVTIEKWNVSFSYENFYETCAPTYCIYTESIHEMRPIEITVTFLSLISGIVFLLRMITPYLVSFIRRFLSKDNNQQQINPQQERDGNRFVQLKRILRSTLKLVWKTLVNLNIFPRRDLGSDVDQMTVQHIGQWSTRFYIVALLTSLIILGLYSIIQPVVQIKYFQEPSFDMYKQLQTKYDDSLKCSCQFISSKYDQFIDIEPEFHEICTSAFTSNEWQFNSTANLLSNLSKYDRRDYRRYLPAHFQYLNRLCQLSIRTANNVISEFLSSSYITTRLVSQVEFDKKLSELIQQMQSSFSETIMNLLYLIESINHGNALVSTYGTNYEYILLWNVPISSTYLPSQAIIYDNNCSCQLYSNCTSQASFFSTNPLQVIPIQGLKIGCLPTTSFHLSTLECFYDQSCINLIQEYIHSNNPSISSLIKASRFPLNTTIDELIENMFIEQLKTQIDYSLYYKQCSPSICSYTYIQYVDLLYTISFLLGLQGGLSIVLKWISPKLIRIVYSLYRYRKRRTTVIQIQTINLPSVSTSSDLRESCFQLLQCFLICLISICLLIIVISFSIYMKSNKNETISTKTMSTFTTMNLPFSSTLTTTTTTTTTYHPNCAVIFEHRSLLKINSSIYSYIPVISDFNNDNRVDIALTNAMIPGIVVLLGYGNGSFSSGIQTTMLYWHPFKDLVVADMNNDGKVDIIFVDAYYKRICVIFGNGDGTFNPVPIMTFYPLIDQISTLPVAADFNNDQYLDIAFIEDLTDTIYLFTSVGNGNFLNNGIILVESNSYLTAVGARDFNNDGYEDIAAIDMLYRNLNLYFGYGNGSFRRSENIFTGAALYPRQMSFADFNNDSFLDIFITYSANELRLLLGYGNGTFTRKDLIRYNGSYENIVISINDLNKDGHLDITIGMISPYDIYILYGDGYGNFWTQIAFSTSIQGNLTWSGVADFNNDGYEDILTIGTSSGIMNILLNTKNCNSN